MEREPERRLRRSRNIDTPQLLSFLVEDEQLGGCWTGRIECRYVYIAIPADGEAFNLRRARRQHRKRLDLSTIPRVRRRDVERRKHEAGARQRRHAQSCTISHAFPPYVS